MTNYIAFSLYGKSRLYIDGALENARQLPIFYPGWQPIFYCGKSITTEVKRALEDLGAIIVTETGDESNRAMYWRFQAVEIDDAQTVIFRDADSRPSARERDAVQEWLASGTSLHIMRDHPNHSWWILGGMWGCQAAKLKGIFLPSRISELRDAYGEDQFFLFRNVYKPFRKDMTVHDSVFFKELKKLHFPGSRDGGQFVGEVISSEGLHDQNARFQISRFERDLRYRLKVVTDDWREMALVVLVDRLKPKSLRKFG